MTASRALSLVPKVRGYNSVRQSSGMNYGSWNFDNHKKTLFGTLKPAENVWKTYRKIFYVLSVPTLLLGAYIAWKDHSDHLSHKRKDYVEYDFLNVRKSPFPFGDGNHTLFHNPSEQWVPGVGYEKERSH